MVSGYSQQISSGKFSLRSPNAGFRGVSGGISLSTGTSSFDNSGMIGLGSGDSTNGHAGDVRLYVGAGDTGAGGDVLVTAGDTTDDASFGGDVIISLTTGLGKATSLGHKVTAHAERGPQWRVRLPHAKHGHLLERALVRHQRNLTNALKGRVGDFMVTVGEVNISTSGRATTRTRTPPRCRAAAPL
jgi:hypothetical protein